MHHPVLSKVFFLSSILVFLFTSCNHNSTEKVAYVTKDTIPETQQDLSIPGSFSPQTVLKFDSTVITKFVDSFSKFKPFEDDVSRFYKQRNYAFAWFDENGLIETAHNLYNRVINISEEGLPDKIPYKEKFIEVMDSANASSPSSVSDLMLTFQYLAYADYAWQGIDEKKAKAIEWLLPRKKLSYNQLLDSLSTKTFENEPVYRQYYLLKAELKKLNDIRNKNQLPIIKTDLKKIKEGDSNAVVSVIRTWLYIMGVLKDKSSSEMFDKTLTDGVKNFQARTGLKSDGVIGPGVISEMNYPLEKRIESIMVNMERSRWVPVSLEKDYLLINIPDYKLYVFEKDTLAFDMNVVVGTEQTKTVVFNGDLKYVVMSPYWYVPASIIKKEITPGIKRNPNYLANHNMEWNGGNVRQKPGPKNSLGLVKFLFPNSHSIYLHDTPSKSLFGETTRAFSHGCIRLSDPKKLAVYLLRNSPNWTEAAITSAMNSGKEQYVTLAKTVPVFIAYFTSWVDKDGKLNFRKDVYKRDTRLAKLILDKPSI